MSTLEQEIYEKFQQLDDDAKRRVLQQLHAQTKPFDFDAWWRDIEEIREQIRASHNGVFPSIDVVGMLRDIRDGEDE